MLKDVAFQHVRHQAIHRAADSRDLLQYPHAFSQGNPLAEQNTRWAVVLTVAMMVGEIVGGWAFGSMALLADGWHMSSHALALGLSAVAYAAARRHAHDSRFAFGTWKIEVLGGYTSAILLLLVAGLMVYQSEQRLLAPAPIQHEQAVFMAALGLMVNLACAWLLRGGHARNAHHSHHEHHAHESHGHSHGTTPADLNLRSAYLHVVADAATSVLAIAALCGGLLWGADWLDPAVAPDFFKRLLSVHEELVHVSIEVNRPDGSGRPH